MRNSTNMHPFPACAGSYLHLTPAPALALPASPAPACSSSSSSSSCARLLLLPSPPTSGLRTCCPCRRRHTRYISPSLRRSRCSSLLVACCSRSSSPTLRFRSSRISIMILGVPLLYVGGLYVGEHSERLQLQYVSTCDHFWKLEFRQSLGRRKARLAIHDLRD